jgi:hypothetical protein
MTAHESFNDVIRRAAGRGVPSFPGTHGNAPKVGSIGIGKGAGSAPRRVPSRSEQINRSIRAAAGYVREPITFDDLYGRRR